MSDPERAYVMKGDDHFAPGTRTLRYDGGITVNALPETIWPYMQQAGQSKGGWYSFERLERLFTFDITNHYDWQKYPQWQNLHTGEFQWFHQAPWSIGEWVTDCSNGENGLYYWAAHSDTATDPTWKDRGPNQGGGASSVVQALCLDLELGGLSDQRDAIALHLSLRLPFRSVLAHAHS